MEILIYSACLIMGISGGILTYRKLRNEFNPKHQEDYE